MWLAWFLDTIVFCLFRVILGSFPRVQSQGVLEQLPWVFSAGGPGRRAAAFALVKGDGRVVTWGLPSGAAKVWKKPSKGGGRNWGHHFDSLSLSGGCQSQKMELVVSFSPTT